MEVRETTEEGRKVMYVSGRLDTKTAPDLEARIKSGDIGDSGLVLDLSDLEYISSAGLRVVLATHKMMVSRGGLTVRNARDTVMEVLDATGFTDVLDIQ